MCFTVCVILIRGIFFYLPCLLLLVRFAFVSLQILNFFSLFYLAFSPSVHFMFVLIALLRVYLRVLWFMVRWYLHSFRDVCVFSLCWVVFLASMSFMSVLCGHFLVWSPFFLLGSRSGDLSFQVVVFFRGCVASWETIALCDDVCFVYVPVFFSCLE